MIRKLVHSLKSSELSVFWRKTLHTYLTPKFLWERVIKDYSTFFSMKNKPISKLEWLFKNIVWFWPTLHDADFWRDVVVGEVMGPEYYVDIGPHSQILVHELLDRSHDKNLSFLDLGCNRGRFLDILFESGVKNLHGVDVCAAAIDSIKEETPELFREASIKLQSMQEFLLAAGSCSIDITYTHGATVELIPSSFPLVREICRVTRESVIFYISESDYLYPRFWENEFRKHGFKLIKLVRQPNNSINRFSLLVFERKLLCKHG